MRASIVWFSGALIAAGCAHNKEHETTEQVRQQQPPAAEAETQGGMTTSTAGDQNCPLQVSGTTLRTEDTSGGAALVFLTSGDVDELRTRVRHMADMHNRMQSSAPSSSTRSSSSSAPTNSSMPGSGMYDTQGSGAPGGGSMGSTDGNTYGGGATSTAASAGTNTMPSSNAREEDIDGGAQLILIVTDPSQTDALRQNVRQHAQDMASGQCGAMLQDGTHGGMQQNGMQQNGMQNTIPQNGQQNPSPGY